MLVVLAHPTSGCVPVKRELDITCNSLSTGVLARTQKGLARVPRSLQVQEATWLSAAVEHHTPRCQFCTGVGFVFVAYIESCICLGFDFHHPHTSLPTNMVRLREIPRTATFAWSPGAASPLIATGTRAGAVDVDFSNKTCLELWDLSLDRQDVSEELQPVVKIDTDSG